MCIIATWGNPRQDRTREGRLGDSRRTKRRGNIALYDFQRPEGRLASEISSPRSQFYSLVVTSAPRSGSKSIQSKMHDPLESDSALLRHWLIPNVETIAFQSCLRKERKYRSIFKRRFNSRVIFASWRSLRSCLTCDFSSRRIDSQEVRRLVPRFVYLTVYVSSEFTDWRFSRLIQSMEMYRSHGTLSPPPW